MKKHDEVFEISLTEIAFTLVLLLVMLLGTRLFTEHSVSMEQKKIIAQQKEALDSLSQLTGLCKPDPEDPISPMMPCNKCVSQVAHISKKEAAESIDLGRDLSRILREIDPKANYQDYKDKLIKVASLVASGKEVIDKSNFDVKKEELDKANFEIKKLKQTVETLRSEDSDRATLSEKISSLETQVEKCEKDVHTVEAQNKYLARIAGLGYPPCWVGSNGKPQYLFTIDLLPDDKLIVNRAWPEERKKDALDMPPVVQVEKYFGQTISMSKFLPFANQILEISNNAKPSACRHFVILKNHIPERQIGDRQRLRIENNFYKLEVLTEN